MPNQEIEYFCKIIPENAKAISISKFVDGTFKDVYVVENAECQCPGAIYHRTQCKHMRIKQHWDKISRPQGYFTVNKAGTISFHPTQE